MLGGLGSRAYPCTDSLGLPTYAKWIPAAPLDDMSRWVHAQSRFVATSKDPNVMAARSAHISYGRTIPRKEPFLPTTFPCVAPFNGRRL